MSKDVQLMQGKSAGSGTPCRAPMHAAMGKLSICTSSKLRALSRSAAHSAA
jgi:hypothetical protein